MDAKDVVRELTKKGVIVTPEIMKRIREGEGLEQLDLTPKRPEPKTKLSVRIRKDQVHERMSVKDFIEYYNNRYAGLRDILNKRVGAVSINKAKGGFSDVSVIGMVKERNNNGFVLEDATGEIDVVGRSDVRQDDVVGVSGVVKEGRLFQKDVVWPDVPEERGTTNPPEINVLLTTFLDDALINSLDDFDLVFVPGGFPVPKPEGSSQKVMSGLPNPCFATINKEGKETLLLIYRPKEPVPVEEGAALLRRRHLMPARDQILSTTDHYLIDPVPDLFWVVSDRRHVERYRGVTIIMTKEQDAVRFDSASGNVYFAYDKQERPAN